MNNAEKPTFKGNVLVCEDNAINQMVIEKHLERVGLTCILAEDGQIGIDIAEKYMREGKQFDLIFMDIHMPVLGGLEAASKLAELGNTTPVIVLTADVVTSSDLENYKNHGVVDALSKPFTSRDLWACLERNLNRKNAPSQERELDEDEEMMKRMRVFFYNNCKGNFSEIINALNAKDIKLAHRLAHSLKSNAAQIGEEALQAAALAVEKSLVNETNALADETLAALGREFNNVMKKLEN